MSNWLTLKMWFSLNPGSLLPVWQYALTTVVIVFFILTIVSWKFHKQTKKTLYAPIWMNIQSFCLTGTIIGALLLFFTYENIRFLSARFWFIIWFLTQAVWGWFIIKRLRKIPDIKKQIADKKEYNKYIP